VKSIKSEVKITLDKINGISGINKTKHENRVIEAV
jgi:hypothetical protein